MDLFQLLVNILIKTSAYLLIGASFALIYGVCRFFHFAHGIIYTAGAYFTYLFKVWLGVPLFPSAILSIILCAALGCITEVAIYSPIRRRSDSPLIFLICSLGIYISLQNLISLIFGDSTKIIRTAIVQEGIDIFGARITLIQIGIICIATVLTAGLSFFLKKTKTGKILRAVANNPVLASISGIQIGKAIFWTFAIGSAFAGTGGILIALDIDLSPTMGMTALMMGIVAMILGGKGNVGGVALGALFLSFSQELSGWIFSAQWQDTVAFVLLIGFLLFRPQGFLGKKLKKITI